jgi:hypothetical protein
MLKPEAIVYLGLILFHISVIIFVLKVIKLITNYKQIAKDYLD